jgi:hypothetical protein
MPRDTPSLTPDEVLAVMTSAVETLASRLPGTHRQLLERVVYEVTSELVSTITDPARLAAMLRLRAAARLTASTGELTPIRSTPRTVPPLREF